MSYYKEMQSSSTFASKTVQMEFSALLTVISGDLCLLVYLPLQPIYFFNFCMMSIQHFIQS